MLALSLSGFLLPLSALSQHQLNILFYYYFIIIIFFIIQRAIYSLCTFWSHNSVE